MKYLKYYVFALAFLFLVTGIGSWAHSLPTKVTITSDKWDCAVPEANGIETYCSNYIMKRNAREKLASVPLVAR